MYFHFRCHHSDLDVISARNPQVAAKVKKVVVTVIPHSFYKWILDWLNAKPLTCPRDKQKEQPLNSEEPLVDGNVRVLICRTICPYSLT